LHQRPHCNRGACQPLSDHQQISFPNVFHRPKNGTNNWGHAKKPPIFDTNWLFMLQIQSFVFNPFQENTLILFDETKECVVIDPGCADESENRELKNFIDSNKLKVKLLLNTHCHVDHVLGNRFVKETYGVDLLIHRLEDVTRKAADRKRVV